MPSLKDIKVRINSVRTTQKTTRAMKMVSAAKLRKAQDGMLRLRPYAAKLEELLARVVSGLEGTGYQSPFLATEAPPQGALLVLITSNRGLAGAFNSAIVKQALEVITGPLGEFHQKGTLHLLCVGRRGYDAFRKRTDLHLVGQNHDVFTGNLAQNALAVAETVLKGYLNGQWTRVVLVYNEFRNIMSQNRRVVNYLPVDVKTLTGGAAPKPVDYLYEPDRAAILDGLIPQILRMQLLRAISESWAAEHGARMVAMDAATENAEELLTSLKLSYNKARQAAITKELIEIVSGADALKAS